MILLVSIFIFFIGVCVSEDVRIAINQGTLLGGVEKTFLRHKSYYAFKGIPFAEPPVGKLRFQPPVPHKGWHDTYEALYEKPTCFQFNAKMRNDEPFGMSGSEDCLYVSVFTPRVGASLPVIVFDHNDNFRTGFNGTRTYAPDFFIEENIIIVTIQHRLDIFGYLTTEDETIPPNTGLNDFVLGLNWVKENIERFGGDPNRVTLMGNKSGAILANILMYSEKARGLFNGVIMQSGTATESTLFATKTRDVAFRLADILRVDANSSKILLDELQKVDAETLLKEEGEAIDYDLLDEYQKNIFPFAPIVEENRKNGIVRSLPDDEDIVNDVPVMMGMNSREGLDLASHYIFEPRLLEESNRDLLFLFPIRTNYRFNKRSKIYRDAIGEIQNFYLKKGYLYHGNILEYAVYLGDIIHNYAMNYAAKRMATQAKSPVFYYVFDYRGQLNENSEHMARRARFSMGNWGATLTDELCYLHLCSRIKRKYEELTRLVSEQQEIKILKRMVRMWANFAKTGNPTPTDYDEVLKNFKWQPIDKVSNETNFLHITKNLRMEKNPMDDRVKFWDEFLKKYSEQSISGVVGGDHLREEL